MATDIVSGQNRIVVMPYNTKWRTIRKVVHQNLMTNKVEQYQPIIEDESCQLLWEYYTEPDRWYLHNNRFANSLILTVLFGLRKGKVDASLDDVLGVSEDFIRQIQIGTNLVDVFPPLARLPWWMQWWRRKGEELYARACRTYGPIQQEMLQRIKNGSAKDCFGRIINERREELGFSKTDAMFMGMLS
jgi:cytochrome P450